MLACSKPENAPAECVPTDAENALAPPAENVPAERAPERTKNAPAVPAENAEMRAEAAEEEWAAVRHYWVLVHLH